MVDGTIDVNVLRDSAKRAKVLCFWTGIGFFFVCAVSGTFSNISVAWNVVSGVAFSIALVIEIFSRRFDKQCESLDLIADNQRQQANEEEVAILREYIGDVERRHKSELADLKQEILNPGYDPYQ